MASIIGTLEGGEGFFSVMEVNFRHWMLGRVASGRGLANKTSRHFLRLAQAIAV